MLVPAEFGVQSWRDLVRIAEDVAELKANRCLQKCKHDNEGPGAAQAHQVLLVVGACEVAFRVLLQCVVELGLASMLIRT